MTDKSGTVTLTGCLDTTTATASLAPTLSLSARAHAIEPKQLGQYTRALREYSPIGRQLAGAILATLCGASPTLFLRPARSQSPIPVVHLGVELWAGNTAIAEARVGDRGSSVDPAQLPGEAEAELTLPLRFHLGAVALPIPRRIALSPERRAALHEGDLLLPRLGISEETEV